MSNHLNFFIDGKWVAPVVAKTIDVINPATEEAFATISVGSAADVDRAVAAAKAAFPAFSQTSKEERLKLLRRILEVYNGAIKDIAEAVANEMGAPMGLARGAGVCRCRAHLEATIKTLEELRIHPAAGGTRVVQRADRRRAALITPWNWPLNQIVCKVAPALAAGCTMVLKPSEIAPISGIDLRRDHA